MIAPPGLPERILREWLPRSSALRVLRILERSSTNTWIAPPGFEPGSQPPEGCILDH